MSTTRRDFLKTATTAALSTALAPETRVFAGQQAAGSDAIRIGLIGCGGRGTGAVQDAITSSAGVTLVAMGDAFADRLTSSRTRLREKFGRAADVPEDRCFTGFDAYQKVLASDVNYVILATPPGFRPAHLSAAVAAGKHIFTEKPVAVDGPGIRTVLEVYEQARAKGLGIAAGTQRRHQTGYVETMRRIHDGAIGNIVSARCYWNQGFLWKKDRQPQWTDAEWQLRNWLYFTWLSGDHIVEQHVHNIDVVNWAMQAHPVSANGMGGRQVRTSPEFGHVFDHFAIDYEYANGATLMSMCRQIEGCDKRVAEALVGDKGRSHVDKYAITGAKAWTFDGRDSRPYVQEHTDFIASIRAGQPYNELKTVAESTLTAIMGRMSAYTGKVVTWDQALNSKEQLMPTGLTLGPLPTPPVAVPGQTPLV
ncbi:MAG TPA: Gfo/Idh/MocA family oxidoreductase [Vicinamibacterales bacterium]|nr:Gfo/Idh/MocA family oxidoreductase [Vicinamibacterales bacterium]